MMSDDKKQEIVNSLTKKIALLECPMCHAHSFSLIDGYFTSNIQDDYRSIVFGKGEIIPSIAIVCNQCGFISKHSIGILGVMKKDNKEDKAK